MADFPGSAPTLPPSSAAPSTEAESRDAPGEPPARRFIYGRRQGPRLRPRARELLSELLPRVGFELNSCQPIDPLALFDWTPRALWLEIGFGGGEHLAAQAARHPDIGFLGVEPFVNGVAKLLRRHRGGTARQCPRPQGRRSAAARGPTLRLPGAGLHPVPRPVAEAAASQTADRQSEDAGANSPGWSGPGASCGWQRTMRTMPAGCWQPYWRSRASCGLRSALMTGASRRPTGYPPAMRTKREGLGDAPCS